MLSRGAGGSKLLASTALALLLAAAWLAELGVQSRELAWALQGDKGVTQLAHAGLGQLQQETRPRCPGVLLGGFDTLVSLLSCRAGLVPWQTSVAEVPLPQTQGA